MNLFLVGIIIFVIVYLFLNWFARTSSKKIATNIKKIAVYLSVILATLLAIGGKYIFFLPFFRLFFRTFCLFFVDILYLKPCFLFLFTLLGCQVLFIGY